MNETQKTCHTNEVKLFVTGPYDKVKDICQEFCLVGLCVSLKRIEYVYTMGYETGVEVTLINYPRFPRQEKNIVDLAMDLGKRITIGCHQGSFTIVTQLKTYFWSRREGD